MRDMNLIKNVVKNADFKKVYLDSSNLEKNIWKFNWYSSRKLDGDTTLTITTTKSGIPKFCSFKHGTKIVNYFYGKQISLFTKLSLFRSLAKLKKNLKDYPHKDTIFNDFFKDANHFDFNDDVQHVEELEWDGTNSVTIPEINKWL
jgi:hypothetical protein